MTPPREVVYHAKRFDVVRQPVERPDGSTAVHTLVVHGGSVGVVPYLGDGRLCLIRNFRPAAGGWLLEVPAGTLEPGEEPETCAARELQEETGYRAGRLTPLVAFYVSPGITTERIHLYLAEQLEAGPQNLDMGERIERFETTVDRAWQQVLQGEIVDAKTIVALACLREKLA